MNTLQQPFFRRLVQFIAAQNGILLQELGVLSTDVVLTKMAHVT